MFSRFCASLTLVLAGCFAQQAHAIRNDLDPPDPTARPMKHLVSYPATGKMKVTYKNGNILVDDAANTITVTTAAYGTYTVSIDDAALQEANGDVAQAAIVRQQFHDSLYPADGVAASVADTNGNHVMDEAAPDVPDCSNPDIVCTNYMRITPKDGGKDEFKRMFANSRMTTGGPAPAYCAIMCEKADSLMEDWLLDSAEVVLACGFGESPPTAALCVLSILHWRKNAQDNHHADYVCHVECQVPY